MPIGGGSTRELLDAVTDADWTPDGSALAVSRQVGHHFQLEFPIGKTLYQNDGYISDVCFSPAGDKIAFIDHALFGDDRGTVEVVDLQGNRKVLTREFSTVQGLAWAPKGNEIWFTAAVNSEPSSLRAVSLEGKERMLLSSPAKLKLQDVSKDGSVLLRWRTTAIAAPVGDRGWQGAGCEFVSVPDYRGVFVGRKVAAAEHLRHRRELPTTTSIRRRRTALRPR